MASICAKCGAEVPANQPSCSACGTPLAAWAPVAAPAQPLTAPAKTGPSALKIVLIIVVVIVGLGILGVGAVSFVIYRAVHGIHVSGSGDKAQMTMNLPGGSFSANAGENFSASDLGTDTYPGATAGKGGAKMTLPGGSWISAVYVTPDSKDQVVSFYKSRLGSELSVYDSADSAVLTAQKSKQEAVIVTVTANKSEYQGKTQITIVHTISTKAN